MYAVRYFEDAMNARDDRIISVCRFNFVEDAEGFALSRGADFVSLGWEEITHPDYEPCI